MNYYYEAKTRRGQAKKGYLEAKNKKAVLARLKDEKLVPVKIKIDWKSVLNLNILSFGYVPYVDKLMFTKHLSVLVGAGIPINEAISILIDQAASGGLKRILRKVLVAVEKGQSLADGLANYPRVFPEIYVNIVRAGEKGGTLEASLNQLAIQLEKEFELRSKIRSAMFYPILVLVAASVIGLSLAIFVLPRITSLFVGFNIELPLLTKILIALAGFFSAYGGYVFVILAVLAVGLFWLLRTGPVRPVTHRLILRVFFIKTIAKDKNLALFSRTLGTLLKSGLPIIEALELTTKTFNNVAYKAVVKKAVKEVEAGTPLAVSLQAYPNYFPPVVYRMIGVGEQSGNLEQVLVYLAEFFEGEVDVKTKNLSTVIEPVLLLVIGLFVALLAVAIISPIYKITGSIGRGR